MTRVGLYSSTLNVGGGGEKYFLSVYAAACDYFGRDVELLAPSSPDFPAWNRLSLPLQQRTVRWRPANDRTVTALSRSFDLFVSMSWGLPMSLAARSVALIQFPPRDLRATPYDSRLRSPGLSFRRFFDRTRVSSYDLLICNSAYVQNFTQSWLMRPDAGLIYPPVTPLAQPGTKKHRILAVGRFISMKRQDTLIRAFRELLENDSQASDWTLQIAGVRDRSKQGDQYLGELRSLAKGLNVEFHADATLEELRDLYRHAAIFWHAAGFERDSDPSQQEHFGMTTVEAMAAGCVPVVINLGGQREIVSHEHTGFLWASYEELVRLTSTAIRSCELRDQIAQHAQSSAARFNAQRFASETRSAIFRAPGEREP